MCEYLAIYSTEMSLTNAFAAPHKYRHPTLSGKTQTILKAWNTGKGDVVKSFLIKVNGMYPTNKRFYVFCVPSNTTLFVQDIREKISTDFQIIDGTEAFKKNTEEKFGSEKFKNVSVEEFEKYINVNQQFIKDNTNKEVSSALIIDDVLASGKSIELAESLIRKYFSHITDIKKCVILKIPKGPETNYELEKKIQDTENEISELLPSLKANPNDIELKQKLTDKKFLLIGLKYQRQKS